MDILKFVVMLYLVITSLLYLYQRQLMYMPTSPWVPTDQSGLERRHFIRGNLTLSGWVVNPDQSRALIYYGGNAEAIEANIEWFKSWLPAYTTYLIPYRGYGGNSGSPSERALYQDAVAIFDEIQSQHHSVALFGRSLGTGIACYVAANRTAEKIVLVSPYYSLQALAQEHYPFFPIRWLLKDKFLSGQHVEALTNETLVVVAGDDQVIEPHHSQRLVDAFSIQTPKMVVIEQATHQNLGEFEEYGAAIQRFLY